MLVLGEQGARRRGRWRRGRLAWLHGWATLLLLLLLLLGRQLRACLRSGRNMLRRLCARGGGWAGGYARRCLIPIELSRPRNQAASTAGGAFALRVNPLLRSLLRT